MARIVQFTDHGGPEVLEIVTVPDPHPGDGRIRVQVRAAGLNVWDTKMREGLVPTTLPSRQGNEFAGVVDEVGPGVTTVSVGDEVVGWTTGRAQADLLVVPARQVAPKPAGLDWATAGALVVVTDTAWNAVNALALTAEDTLLITGAAGGVGLLASQLATATGATVVGTARPSTHDVLIGFRVIPVEYGPGELGRLRAAVPGPFTAALDTVGRESVELALELGIPADRIDSIAYFPGEGGPGIRTVGSGTKTPEEVAAFAERVSVGDLVVPIQAEFAFEEVRAAYEQFETGHGLGKIVLTFP